MMPVQYHIARCFIRFWNRLCEADGGTDVTDACIDAQIDLACRKKSCWLKSWMSAFEKLIPGSGVAAQLSNGGPLDENTILQMLEQQYYGVLQCCGNHQDVACPNRRTAFVFNVINRRLGHKPKFSVRHSKLPVAAKRQWWQFCSAQAALPVHTLRHSNVQYENRMCNKCSSGAVGDEHHALLVCPATQSVRSRYAHVLSFRANMNLADFVDINQRVAQLPCFVAEVLQFFRA